MRASQIWHWLYFRGVTDFSAMTNVVEAAARGARRALRADAAGDRRRAGVGGRHAEMAAALPAARRRPAGRGGDGLHPRGGARHALRLEPGRLHAHLHLLPYRHAAHGAQPDRRGDRRADPGRTRAARRFSRRRDAAGRDRAGRGAARLQRRDDGDGRAALQFRQREGGAAHRLRRRRHRALEAADHALDLRRRADDPARRRRDRHDARDLAACGARRASRRAGADQQEMADRRAARRLPRLSRPLERAAHHLRIRDAEGRQRLARRGDASWCGCWRASPPRST